MSYRYNESGNIEEVTESTITNPVTGEECLATTVRLVSSDSDEFSEIVSTCEIDEYDADGIIAAAEETASFKESRQAALDSATITTSAGNTYDADEISITRMGETISAIEKMVSNGTIESTDDYEVNWIMADNETSVATSTTFDDLEEAYIAACELRSEIMVGNFD